MSTKQLPVFKDKVFLINHARSIMDFYHPRCIDYDLGGFFHQLEMMEVFMIQVQDIL